MRPALLAALLLAAGTARADDELVTLKVETSPEKSKIEVRASDGKVYKGRSPWSRKLPPGETKIEATLKKHRPFKETLDLKEDRQVVGCLDPDDQLVHCVRIIPCGLRPKSVVLSKDGKEVWVATLWGPTTLQIFETATGKKLVDLSLGKHGGTELELSADRKKVYLSQMSTGQVHEFDFATRKLLRSFDTKGSWTKVIKISHDGKTLFASNWVSSDISVVDLETGKFKRRIKTVRKPRGMYPTEDGKYLYVAGFKKGELQKIDLTTGKGKIVYKEGVSLRHIVADEAKKRLFISDINRGKLLNLDLETDKVKLFAQSNNKPNTIDLGPGAKVLFVSNRGKRGDVEYTEKGPEWGSVLLFDATSAKILDAIVAGNQPTALAISDDGKTLVFSDFLDNRLRVYRVPSYEELLKGGGGRAKSHLKDLPKATPYK
jgi:DNA-binding beta-propeller fold protein YncE